VACLPTGSAGVPSTLELTSPLSQVAVTLDAATRPSKALNPLTFALARPPPAVTDAELALIVPSLDQAPPESECCCPSVLLTDGVALIGAAPVAERPYAASW
jgi:hypothetical protein